MRHTRRAESLVGFRRDGRHALRGLVAAGLLCLAVSSATADAAVTASDDDGVFNIAFTRSMFSTVNAADAQVAIKTWIESMRPIDGRTILAECHVVDDAAALEALLRAGRADGTVANVAEYLQIENGVPLSPLFTGTWGDVRQEECLLLVHREGSRRRVEDLRGGRTLLWVSHRTSLAELWLRTLRAEHGLNEVADPFGRITTSSKLSSIVLPVFFRQADACVVTRLGWETLTELNPQVGRQLQVIASSEPLVTVVVSLRADYQSPSRDVIIAGLRQMHEDPRGRQILTLFHGDGLIEGTPAVFDTARRLRRAAAGLPPLDTTDEETIELREASAPTTDGSGERGFTASGSQP